MSAITVEDGSSELSVPRGSVARRLVIAPVVRAFNPAPGAEERREGSWRGFSSQITLVTIAALLYFGVRMVTKSSEVLAFANARSLIEFERRIGIFIEHSAQSLIIDNAAVVTFFNWVYIWLHWPVIVFAFIFLFRYRRTNYVLFRNAMFVSGAIGLVFFLLFPVAPPRFLVGLGFTDTVTELSTSYKLLQPPSIVNKYAALPSFHVGWNVLAAVMLYRTTRFLPLRLFAVLSPTLMTLAVVLTANHWVIDAVVGAAIALLGLGAAVLIRRLTRQLDLDTMASPAAVVAA